jgi:hypothetical protein
MSGRVNDRAKDRRWDEVRAHVDQVPPVALAEVVGRRASAEQAGPGRRWVLVGVTVALAGLAIAAVALRQNPADDGGVTASSVDQASREAIPRATYTIPGAELISNALVVDDELWVTAVVDGAPELLELDVRDGSQVQSIDLPGEVTVGGMVRVQGYLWLATVDELGTVGTGVVQVGPSSGELHQFPGLDRAATLATDGHQIWVRGQSLLQTLSVPARCSTSAPTSASVGSLPTTGRPGPPIEGRRPSNRSAAPAPTGTNGGRSREKVCSNG